MLSFSDLHLAFGDTELLFVPSWTIHRGQRVALVGPNGSGKTTMLRTILGLELPVGGRVEYRTGLNLGYLPQQAVSGSTLSLWDEAASGMTWLIELEDKLNQAQNQVEQGVPGSENLLLSALDSWQLAGGSNKEEIIGSTLHGLGFSAEDWSKSCAEFSGGWQMRIALAKVLLSQPDIAILDEPTNHLDAQARHWLGEHLSQVSYAVLVVSHDRTFLDKMSTHVVEIRDQMLHTYKGSYSQFLQLRAEKIRQAQQAYDKQREEIKHLQQYIDRFGAKATKAKQAQSRKKQLEKITPLQAPQRLNNRSNLRFLEAPPSDPIPFELRNATIGWPNEPPLLQCVNLILERGMRLVLVGPNGCGKSTLLKTIVGSLPLQDGRRISGNRIRMGVYSQDLAQSLPHDQSPVQYIHERCPMSTETAIRTTLGALGLSSLAHTRDIRLLSGGEKARVVLAELSLHRSNVLLLDEPTNHLDTESADALTKALQHFEGAVLLISHDVHLLSSVATHTAHINENALNCHIGYVPWSEQTNTENAASSSTGQRATTYKEQQQARNQRQRLERSFQQMEERIEQLELELEKLNAQMFGAGDDLKVLQDLAMQKEGLEHELDRAVVEWEQLDELLQKMSEP